MPRQSVLLARAREKGLTIETMLRETLRDEGSVLGAARVLRVSPNSIHFWTKQHGFRVVIRCQAELVQG